MRRIGPVERAAAVLRDDPIRQRRAALPVTDEWLDERCGAELLAPAEVVPAHIPPGDSLHRNIVIRDGALGRPVLVAARNFKAGELILAEIAVAARPVDSARGAAEDLADTEESCRDVVFTGPFDATRGAALRLFNLLAPAAAVYGTAMAGGTSTEPSRRQVIAAAFLRASLRCSCGSDNPYVAAAARPTPLVDGAPVAAASTDSPPAATPPAPLRPGMEYDAVFVRAPLLAHACDANCGLRSTFESGPHAPAVQIFALRDVRAGEALTLTRVDPSLEWPARQRLLKSRWGAECGCVRCASSADAAAASTDASGAVAVMLSDDTLALRCPACTVGRISIARAGGAAEAPAARATCSSGCRIDVDTLPPLLERRRVALEVVSAAITACVPSSPPAESAPMSPAVEVLAESLAELHAAALDVDAAAWRLMYGAATALYRLEEQPRSLATGDATVVAPADAELGVASAVGEPPRQAQKGQPSAPRAAGPLPPPAPLSRAAALAASLSARVTAAAAALADARVISPLRLLHALVDHALLTGGVGDAAESARAWARAAPLAVTFHGASAPGLAEAYAAFAAKPPRTRGEAALAERIRLHVLHTAAR